MLTQCNGFAFFPPLCVALLAQLTLSCDAQHALVVDHVAFALDERVFGLFAIPYFACVLEARTRHIVPFQHALRVDPKNGWKTNLP